MSLVQQLFATVTPLSDYQKDCEKRQAERAKTKQNWKRNNIAANKAIHEAAVAKYKAAMGDEWVLTTIIESRLGMSRSSCTPNLMKWEDQGIVEKRRKDAGRDWVKSDGNEWRFVK